jgi:acetyltransferase
MRNLLSGGYANPIMPVNPKHGAVAGVLAYPSVASLPMVPDLAIIATPAPTVPGLITELGERGTRAALVVTTGMDEAAPDDARTYQQQMVSAARPRLLRILGPDCVGLMVPGLGLNASLTHRPALAGNIAFITQSRALAATVHDWAGSNGIGFSYFISLGKAADVDFGDLLDYLGSDSATRAILLYMESLTAARKFMSAARAAARNKPVVVIKAGRAPEAAMAAASHTGALAGADDVFDTAIRRAGMLRVYKVEELFAVVETLARGRPVIGDRLTILSNGGGPGIMATDHLIQTGGRLAELSEETRGALDEVLPAAWSRRNPVDIPGRSPVEQYVQVLKILLQDRQSDALVFIHAPTEMVPSERIAEALVPLIKTSRRNVLSCWLGVDATAEARRIFSANGIPTYRSPEEAVGVFMQEVDYNRNHKMLMETPPSLPTEFKADREAVRKLVGGVLADGRQFMTEPEAKAVLAAYGIPVVETRIAVNADEAVTQAQAIGFPVAVKLLSPDVNHKSDVGGVALDIDTPEGVRAVVARMAERLQVLKPEARVDGFSVQRMARRPEAHELIVGAATDAVFGPVILFGRGGISVEVIADRAVALPPLNLNLARELVSRTRVSHLLAGYRNRPPADRDAVYRTLLQISQLITDIPEISELDINPLLVDEHGVIALDARIHLVRSESQGPERLAIRPYPQELEETIDLHGRPVLIRPIRPEDEPAHREFFVRLHSEDVRYRFFHVVRALPRSELARLTQIDYDREMAFIATAPDKSGRPETLGVVRVVADPDNRQAEFAIIVLSDLKRKGLGSRLMEKIVQYCRDRGTGEMVMSVMAANRGMLGLAQRFNFERVHTEDGVTEMRLRLR